MKTKSIFLMLAALIFSMAAFAQEPADTTAGEKMVVTTHDGVVRVGMIRSDDGREILLETDALGNIYIRKSDIKSIVPLTKSGLEEIDGDYRTAGPFTTRYYFTTNSLPIKKGEDYALLNLYVPEVHFSVADNLSVGLMSTWLASPFAVALKLSLPTSNEKVNFGLGTLAGTSGYINNFRGYGGLHWGMMTLGDRMRNITFSAGFLYLQNGNKQSYEVPGTYSGTANEFGGYDFPDIPYREVRNQMFKSPSFSIAGVTRVGRKSSFIFDSMLFTASQHRESRSWNEVYDSQGIPTITIADNSGTEKFTLLCLMPGLRFQHREDRAFQIALAGVTVFQDGEVTSFPLPNCSWFFKI